MTLPWNILLEQLGGEKRIHYSLENIQKALLKIGSPEKNVKSIVIGGTNGKGTTTLLVSAALRLHGYRVATYLSPHLQHLKERFLENLVPWKEERLAELCTHHFQLARDYDLSYFEFLTLLFFLNSSHQKMDFNVVEVGMGGRLDATNVTDPKAAVITNIGWDHCEYLGDTLGKILGEKMGILRAQIPVVSALKQSDLRALLEAQSKRLSSPLIFSSDYPCESLSWDWSGQEAMIDGHSFHLNNPTDGTLQNATLAYALIRNVFPEISVATIQKAFSSVVFPGRFERVQKIPQVILSGDHNEDGMECLLNILTKMNSKNLYILCGFSPDKNAEKMISMLKPFSRELILTEVPRARGVYEEHYSKLATFEKDPQIALKNLEEKLQPSDTLLVTGSLYLVGDLRKKWFPEVQFLL